MEPVSSQTVNGRSGSANHLPDRCQRELFVLGCFLFVLLASLPADLQSQQLPASSQVAHDSRYPAHWWTPISKEGAPAWEILPQEASPGEVILSKRNELGLLSNFAATPFTFKGKR